MLAGKVPFPSDSNVSQERNSYEVSEHHKNTRPPAIEPLRKDAFEAANPDKTYTKDYPDWLETVILKCLEKKPENRYANGKELYEDIKNFVEKDSKKFDIEELKNRVELVTLKQQNKNLSIELSKLAYEKQQLEQQGVKIIEKIVEKPVEVIKTVEKRVEVPVEKIVEKTVYKDTNIKKNKPFFVVASIVLLLTTFLFVALWAANPKHISDADKTEQVAQLQSQLKTAQSGNANLSALQNEILQLKKDKASLQQQLNTAQSNSGNTADLQRQINNLRSEISTKDAKIKKLEKEKQALIDNM
jgi:serine/threonine protein kinase